MNACSQCLNEVYQYEHKGPLTRREKIKIISSILAGAANQPNYSEEVIRARIDNILKLTEKFI